MVSNIQVPVVSRSAPPLQWNPVKGTSSFLSSDPSQSSLPPFDKYRNKKSNKNDFPLRKAPKKEEKTKSEIGRDKKNFKTLPEL